MNTSSPAWSPSPENLTIQEGELHIWRANLDVPAYSLEALRTLLSQEEVERATRFYFSKDRDRFIVSHACVRNVLSRYLAIVPEMISFTQNSYGKPALSTESGEIELEFNLTHSQRFAMVAVTQGLHVGIDVESIRTDFGGLKIAKRFFSPSEFQALISLPEEQQSEAFFRCWTRKEAYIKAKGKGLSIPLNEFDVSVHPGDPVAIRNTGENPGEAVRWTLIQVDPAPGYSGAVAVEGQLSELKLWDWTPEINMVRHTGYETSLRDS